MWSGGANPLVNLIAQASEWGAVGAGNSISYIANKLKKNNIEIKRVNGLLQDQKKKNLFSKIFGGISAGGVVILAAATIWLAVIR